MSDRSNRTPFLDSVESTGKVLTQTYYPTMEKDLSRKLLFLAKIVDGGQFP